MKGAAGEPDIGGEQLQLLGLGPLLGGRYRNVNTGKVVTVLEVIARLRTWVTIRTPAGPQTITLASFERHFESYQPTKGRQ